MSIGSDKMGRSPLALALTTVLAAGCLFSIDAARTSFKEGRTKYDVTDLMAPDFDNVKLYAPDPLRAGQPSELTFEFRNTGEAVEDGELTVSVYYDKKHRAVDPIKIKLGRVVGKRAEPFKITFPFNEMSYNLVLEINDRKASRSRLRGGVRELRTKLQSASTSSAIEEQ